MMSNHVNVCFSWSNNLQMDTILAFFPHWIFCFTWKHVQKDYRRKMGYEHHNFSGYFWPIMLLPLHFFTLCLCNAVSFLYYLSFTFILKSFDVLMVVFSSLMAFVSKSVFVRVGVCAQLASALTPFTSLTVCVSERWWWHVTILVVAGCPLEVAASVTWSFVRGGALKVVGGESTSYAENGYAIEQWVCACVFMPVFECTDVPSAWQSR